MYRDCRFSPRSSQLFTPSFLTSKGFSLIELLVVCCIISFLAVMTVGALNTINGFRITSAANLLNSQLQLVRQKAITAGTTMELRLYQLPDASGASVYSAFRIVRTGQPANDGTTNVSVNESRILHLPDGVVMNTNSPGSTVLAQTGVTEGIETVGASTVTYRAIRFYPNGSTDLSDTLALKWTITLALAQAPVATNRPTGLPLNYATVAIDALLGTTAIYRP